MAGYGYWSELNARARSWKLRYGSLFEFVLLWEPRCDNRPSGPYNMGRKGQRVYSFQLSGRCRSLEPALQFRGGRFGHADRDKRGGCSSGPDTDRQSGTGLDERISAATEFFTRNRSCLRSIRGYVERYGNGFTD